MSKSSDEIIQEAMQRGEFDNLPGKGKPLNLDDYFDTPEDLRLAYSVLKNANYLPEEAVLLKEIGELEEQYKKTSAPEKRSALLKEIETRRLKYNLLMERFTRHRR
jgi:hypothetical protein